MRIIVNFQSYLKSKELLIMNKALLICNMLLLLALSSCTSIKDLNYLAEDKNEQRDQMYKLAFSEYQLQPNDILNIQIKSTDEELSAPFNAFQGNSNQMMQSGASYLTGYTLSSTGDIEMPILGKVNMAGKTSEEAKLYLKDLLKPYLKEPIVKITLMSFTVTILGEVNSPGQITVYRERLNIIDLIGMAGDINYYGNRKKVKVIRTVGASSFSYELDLTDKNLMASKDFWIAPNDIIFIKPTTTGLFRINATDYAVMLSTITSTISLVVLFLSLNSGK